MPLWLRSSPVLFSSVFFRLFRRLALESALVGFVGLIGDRVSFILDLD
jgi:hypothetical protein